MFEFLFRSLRILFFNIGALFALLELKRLDNRIEQAYAHECSLESFSLGSMAHREQKAKGRALRKERESLYMHYVHGSQWDKVSVDTGMKQFVFGLLLFLAGIAAVGFFHAWILGPIISVAGLLTLPGDVRDTGQPMDPQ